MFLLRLIGAVVRALHAKRADLIAENLLRFPRSVGFTIATRDERRSFPAVGSFLLGGPVCPGQSFSAFSDGSSARGGLQDSCSSFHKHGIPWSGHRRAQGILFLVGTRRPARTYLYLT